MLTFVFHSNWFYKQHNNIHFAKLMEHFTAFVLRYLQMFLFPLLSIETSFQLVVCSLSTHVAILSTHLINVL